ncbi:MAG: DegT/DnrJ/EryC1/StrS family aminotransferase [Myxococcota bacterium]
MNEIPLVDLARRHDAVADEVEARVLEVLRSGRYVGGPLVAEVEAQAATWLGGVGAVGVGNGTDALMLGLQALGVKAGDEVIVPALSFFATAGAVLARGAIPVIVDVTEAALIDPQAVKAAWSPQVHAIIPVHLFGSVTDPIDVGVPVLDDAAQAIGAVPHPMHGRLAAVSAYPTKPWGAAGDAGFVVGRDADVLDQVRRLANHGRTPEGAHVVAGRNSRLDALQAAVLLGHAPTVAARQTARQRRAQRYDQGLPSRVQALPRTDGSSVSQYCVLVNDRRRVQRHLANAGMETGVYYPRPLHEEPALRHARVTPTPVANHLAERLLALPIADVDDADVDRVLAALHEVCR